MASPRKPPPRRPGARPQSPRRSTATSGSSAHGTAPARAAGARSSAAPRSEGPPARAARPARKRAATAPERPASGSAAREAAPPTKKRPRPLGPAPVLSTRQRAHLRGLGHHLAPVVQVGKEGLTDALCQAIGVALLRHELIKLRLAESVEGDRHELATEIAARSHAALVQVLGRTLLLFRPRPDDSEDTGERRPHVTLH